MSHKQWSSVLEDCLALLPLPEGEEISRRESLGRLLLETVVADRDYPIGNLSMMDGYAVADDSQGPFIVAGENTPGDGPGASLRTGEARRIFTGAELPRHASRVVPQELTSRDGDRLTVQSWPKTSYVRASGSEGRSGDIVVEAGTRIGPVEQSLLATVGKSHVRVARLPRIAHLVTGDELAGPDEPSPGSMIRDSNSDLVAMTLHLAGYALAEQRRIGDDRAALLAAVQAAAETCNFLLISGGASVGDHDHARAALEGAGFHFEVHGIHLRPGKPIGMARRGDQWAIALPGNPVSHLVALRLFVIPILRGLEGEKNVAPAFVGGVLAEAPTTGTPQRPTFWPAKAVLKGGVYHLTPRRFLSSGDLIGIAGTNALLFLDAGVSVPPQGAKVLFLPL